MSLFIKVGVIMNFSLPVYGEGGEQERIALAAQGSGGRGEPSPLKVPLPSSLRAATFPVNGEGKEHLSPSNTRRAA